MDELTSLDDLLDTHYQVVLDEPEPEPEPIPRQPIYVDAVVREHERRPIVPVGMHRGNIRGTLAYQIGLNWHRSRYHAARSPWYALQAAFWSVVGVFRLVGKQIRFLWHPDHHRIYQQAVTEGDHYNSEKHHKTLMDTRRGRAWKLGLELAALIALYAYLRIWAPAWVTVLVVLVAVPFLAHHGRPAAKPIIAPAVVPPRYREITQDVVLRAYYAAKLGDGTKDEQQVRFGSTMQRDGNMGGVVVVDLPFGRTFKDAMNARGAIASGLDVSINQVFLTKDKTSERRHTLYVADVDPLAIPAGRTPLLACKPTDVWKPAPFGLDERGRKVTVPLMWNSILVGAQPRKGKTFSARLLGLYAALDPYAQVLVADGKNSPDWIDFRLVAHRFVSGTHPNPITADPIPELLDMLREVKAHIQQVNNVLAALPTAQRPEGKITPELSRRDERLRPWLLVMEEFQNYYETDSKQDNMEIAKLLSFILAVGPSAGVTVLSSSQKPSGIGSGDAATLFTRYRDNHAGRFALKCGSRQVSEAILGTEAYGAGFDAAALPEGPEYRGVGILYGLSDDTPTVRTHLATGEDATKILHAARAHRLAAGTLTGHAAGEDAEQMARDVARDVRSVFYAGEAWVSWPQLAQRLAEQFPGRYAETTAAAISAQVRELGIEPKKGRDAYQDGASVWGVPRENLDEHLARRDLEVRR